MIYREFGRLPSLPGLNIAVVFRKVCYSFDFEEIIGLFRFCAELTAQLHVEFREGSERELLGTLFRKSQSVCT